MQYALLSLALASCSSAFQIPEGSDFGAVGHSLQKRQVYTSDPGPCSDSGVHIIAAGGGNYSNPYAYGRLGSLPDAIMAKIPNSSKVSLPYDKLKDPNDPANLTATAIPNGIITAKNYIASYHAKCPNTKIVTLGYSSGAVIMMSALCGGGVDMSLAGSTIIANIAYGDETRAPGASFDKGTCITNGGKNPRNPSTCGSFSSVTQSYCDLNDPQCCSGPAQDYMVHFVYPGKYDQTAANYVAMAYAAAGGSTASSSSSSSASATTLPSTTSGGLGAATSSATSAASSAASSAVSSAAAAISSAASAVASPASSAAAGVGAAISSAAPTPSSTLAPYNPDNGVNMVVPSLGLGAVAFIFAALL